MYFSYILMNMVKYVNVNFTAEVSKIITFIFLYNLNNFIFSFLPTVFAQLFLSNIITAQSIFEFHIAALINYSWVQLNFQTNAFFFLKESMFSFLQSINLSLLIYHNKTICFPEEQWNDNAIFAAGYLVPDCVGK